MYTGTRGGDKSSTSPVWTRKFMRQATGKGAGRRRPSQRLRWRLTAPAATHEMADREAEAACSLGAGLLRGTVFGKVIVA